jgi:hypothetical protein
MNNFKQKCHMRQKPKNLTFLAEDVETAIEMLATVYPTHPLQMSVELCDLCRSQPPLRAPGFRSPGRQGTWSGDNSARSSFR